MEGEAFTALVEVLDLQETGQGDETSVSGALVVDVQSIFGNLRLFENAQKLGDYLIVAVQDGDMILSVGVGLRSAVDYIK